MKEERKQLARHADARGRQIKTPGSTKRPGVIVMIWRRSSGHRFWLGILLMLMFMSVLLGAVALSAYWIVVAKKDPSAFSNNVAELYQQPLYWISFIVLTALLVFAVFLVRQESKQGAHERSSRKFGLLLLCVSIFLYCIPLGFTFWFILGHSAALSYSLLLFVFYVMVAVALAVESVYSFDAEKVMNAVVSETAFLSLAITVLFSLCSMENISIF